MADTGPQTNTIADRYGVVRSAQGYARLHEEAIRATYEAVLRPGDTAIDGGAHTGKHAIPMAAAVGPSGHVFAFEPSPGPFQRLSSKLDKHELTNVSAIPKAVSNETNNSQSFLVFPERPGVSGFERRSDAAGELSASEIQVETTTIDSYLDQLGPTRFIKLDVEGAELNALFGARAVINAHLPVIHIEAAYVSWDAFGYGPNELLAFCADFGYRIVDVIGTPLDSFAAVDLSFTTPSVWDYVLLPPGAAGATAELAIRQHAAEHYGL